MGKYFTNNDVNSMFGIKIPMALVQDKVFRKITPTGKLLYGVIADWIEIARMNNIKDEDGISYINLNLKYLADIFDISEHDAKKHIAELMNIGGTGIGLIMMKCVADEDRIYLYRFGDIYKYLKVGKCYDAEDTRKLLLPRRNSQKLRLLPDAYFYNNSSRIR